jgi:uncharacterized protein YraI
MIVKSLLVVSILISAACTSNDEAAPPAGEPVAPESAELSDKPAEEAPAAEPTPETPEASAPAVEPAPASEPAAAASPAGDFYIAVSHLNVRSGPGMANSAVEVLTFNTAVQSQGVENRIWVKVGEGRYVSKNYLSEQKLSQPVQVQSTQQQQAAPVAAPAMEQPAAEQTAA